MINYSIIVPHYESLDVLHRAVNSVPDRGDVELIIVDNSRNKIDSNMFQTRSNVHVYYSTSGTGAGAARNIGLQKAIGKWLLFLDADDFFLPTAFEHMNSYKDSSADIVFFKATSCFSDTLQPSFRAEPTNQAIMSYLATGDDSELRYCWGAPWAKMIRRSLVAEHDIQFDEVKASNDIMFSLKVGFYAKSIDTSNESIYCVTVHEGSLTLTPSLENLTARIEVACRYNTFIKKHNLPREQLSIMYFLLCIFKSEGIIQTLKLFNYSIRQGNNPFNGITRWLSTYLSMKKE